MAAAIWIAIVAFLWAIVAFLLGVAIINWNVQDVIMHGPNFWNIFWLSLVAVVWFGTGKSVSK